MYRSNAILDLLSKYFTEIIRTDLSKGSNLWQVMGILLRGWVNNFVFHTFFEVFQMRCVEVLKIGICWKADSIAGSNTFPLNHFCYFGTENNQLGIIQANIANEGVIRNNIHSVSSQ